MTFYILNLCFFQRPTQKNKILKKMSSPVFRVDLPMTPCVESPQVIGRVQGSTRVTPENITYHQSQTYVREFGPRYLSLYQKPEYLAPEYWNTGCSTWYGSSDKNSGPMSGPGQDPETQHMYNTLWHDDMAFVSNHPFPSCQYCQKGAYNYNSVNGWGWNQSGKLNWEN